MNSLPFNNPAGLEYPSIIRVEESAVVVEFRKWSWRKMSKQIIEVSIPINEVTSVQSKTGTFGDHIDLQLRSIQAAGDIPCRKPGLLEMRFAKKHREATQQLASLLKAAVAEERLDQLDREMRRLEEQG